MATKKIVTKNSSKNGLKQKFLSREGALESVREIEFVYFKYISIIVLVLIASFWLVVDGYWYIGVPILVFFLAIPWIAEKMEEMNLIKKK
ncbi:MAG: hypothetical protein WCW44_05500 [archaeon]|jgi:hypothetical protein